MSNKRWACIVGIALLAMMSCSLNICGFRQGYERAQVSDTNWIVQSGDSYTFWRREGSVSPDSAALHFSRFFGKETLWTLEVQQQGYLNIASTVDSPQGPFALVLVQATKKQVIHVANHQGPTQRRYYLEKGTYTIKILGYDASGSIAVTLSYPRGITCSVSTMRF